MKLKHTIIVILALFIIIMMNIKCDSKYVFEDTKKAVEIVVNN